MADARTLYVLDGSYYIFRAFYAIGGMTNGRGLPTNGLFAFTGMLLNVIRDHRPDYLVVTFDPSGPTFRNEMYEPYKANRDEPPEDLVPQFPWFRKIVEALTIPILEVPGYEADDCIGTLVRMAERRGMHVTILSGDKDLFQLIDEDTVMVDSMRGKRVDLDAVKERFQVEPARVPDVLGLAGDTSDNIPGVPGIGEKTAGQLISQFGSLDELLARIDEVSGPKRRENLAAHKEQALLSRDLATIRTDVPVTFDEAAWRLTPPDFAAFDALCTELAFTRYREQVRALFEEESREEALSTAADQEYVAIHTAEALDAAIAAIRAAGEFAFDLETTSVDPLDAEIVGFALAWKPGHGVYVPVRHRDLLAPPQLDADWVLSRIRPLLEDDSLRIHGQHTKYELAILARHGITIAGIGVDTMLAAYLLDPNQRRYGLDALAEQFLRHRTIHFSDVAGHGKAQKTFDEISIDEATPYAAEDADVTLRLARTLGPLLDEAGLRSLHDDVEVPLTRVLARMETTGIRVDVPFLHELQVEFRDRLVELERSIWDAAGEEFTIQSPKQLGVILFEKLGLPVQKKTKTGPSTDQSVLEALKDAHPLVGLILSYRQLAKLQSTYVEALPGLVRADTGRIHTDFNQAVAATGRLSSSNPNLQNIPIRTQEGRRIREAFIPADGWSLLACDYSQIELRVLAHLSEDPVLIDAFQRGDDIHRRTAAEVFGVPQDEVTSAQRGAAKAINFGVIYGMGSTRLADELGISRSEAKSFIDNYFERLAAVKPYFDRVVSDAAERGFAETLLGRRRPIPELTDRSQRNQALGERLAMNTPIQGTAADLIKLAMVRIDRELRAGNFQTRMLLQVHDELVFESPDVEREAAHALVVQAMQEVMPLRVPLKVDSAWGANWAALK